MTEFFLNQECGITQYHDTVLKHHFTFGTHYEPTKFGRSTLRRADYISLKNNYTASAERNYILLLYPLTDNDIYLKLNDTEYTLEKNQLSSFILPRGTAIYLSSNIPSDILLFECDIFQSPPEIMVFDILDKSYDTDIQVISIYDNITFNPQNKPFFGFILDGNVMIDTEKLTAYEGFYHDKPVSLIGNAKILSFSMPVPL